MLPGLSGTWRRGEGNGVRGIERDEDEAALSVIDTKDCPSQREVPYPSSCYLPVGKPTPNAWSIRGV